MAAAVLFVIAVVRARRRREASIGGVILAAFIFAAFAGASGYLGWRYGRLAVRLHERWLPEGNVLMSGAYAATMVAFIVAAWLALYVLVRKKFAAGSIALGALAVWVVAALLSSWFMAGASFLAVWPLLGAILAAGVAAGARPDAPPRAWRALVALLCSVPAIVIVWPLVDALFGTMGLAPESGAAMGALTALGLGAIATADRVHRGAPPMVAGRDRGHHRGRVPGCRGERNALLGPSSQAGEPLLRDGCRRADRRTGPRE